MHIVFRAALYLLSVKMPHLLNFWGHTQGIKRQEVTLCSKVKICYWNIFVVLLPVHAIHKIYCFWPYFRLCSDNILLFSKWFQFPLNFLKTLLDLISNSCIKLSIYLIFLHRLGDTCTEELKLEMEIMKLVDHPHIIALFGCNTIFEPKSMVMEYAQFGDLHDYLLTKLEKVYMIYMLY